MASEPVVLGVYGVGVGLVVDAVEHGFDAGPGGFRGGALGLCESWFYKWRDRQPPARQQRRAELAVKIREVFDASRRHLRLAADHPRFERREHLGLGLLPMLRRHATVPMPMSHKVPK